MNTKLRTTLIALLVICFLPVLALRVHAQEEPDKPEFTEEEITTDQIWDYDLGDYGFTTFEELEYLLQTYSDSLRNLYYEGEEDLVISRSVTFPANNGKFTSEQGKVIVPAGVTLDMNGTSFYAPKLQVDGQMHADWVDIEYELTVNGSMTVSYLSIDNGQGFTGRENVTGDADYKIICRYYPDTYNDFYASLDEAAIIADAHVTCYIMPEFGNVVIDRDCTIPQNTHAYFTSVTDSALTLNAGCTLTVDGSITFRDSDDEWDNNAVINGTLINNGGLSTYQTDLVFNGMLVNNGSFDYGYQTAWFADDSCYSGTGIITIECYYYEYDYEVRKEDFREGLIGLDLSRFEIDLRYNDEDVSNIYNLKLRTCMPHTFDGNICTVCGLDRNVGFNVLDKVYRLAGETRVETALKCADLMKEALEIEKFDNIVIANAKNYPDALAGSYLANCMKAPLILTMDGYHEMVREYLWDNLSGNGTVYILGGYNAVSEEFSNTLYWMKHVRLSGTDRFDTNIKILNSGSGEFNELLVCTAYGFADSLSISATGKPVLLVGNTLTEQQKEFLSQHTPDTICIIGGTGAVSTQIEEELLHYTPYVSRLAGKDRYETSLLVAQEYFTWSLNAVLAYSQNFPDGLSGGPLAYILDAPLLLTKSGNMTCASYCYEYEIYDGCVMGSDELIDDATARKYFNAYQVTVR